MIFTSRNEVVAKVMFLQVCVCPQGGGCLPQCMLGCHSPPWMMNPPEREPPRMENPPDGEPPPPDGEPPGWRPPQMENPPRWRTPPWMEKPPREADSSIWSTSGQYASYWNAFLYVKVFTLHLDRH